MNKGMDFLTIVSGQPRSGTSLMMRILATSGIQPIADEHISYETPRITDIKDKWVEKLPNGVCLKVLFPYVDGLPFKTRNIKLIWMYRNPKEQAWSQRKSIGATRMWAHQQVEKIKEWEKEVPPLLSKLCDVLRVSFDKLIKDQDLKAVEEFLGIPLENAAIKPRKPSGKIYSLGEFERVQIAKNQIISVQGG